MLKYLILCALLTTSLLPNSGCITIGPRTKTEYIVIRRGNPIQILEPLTVRCRRIEWNADNSKAAVGKIDVTGWIAMPDEHWTYIMERLEAQAAEISRLKKPDS